MNRDEHAAPDRQALDWEEELADLEQLSFSELLESTGIYPWLEQKVGIRT